VDDANLDLLDQATYISSSKKSLRSVDGDSWNQGPGKRSEFTMLDSLPKQTAGEIEVSKKVEDAQRRRRKRHRAQRQKRLERFQKKALIAFLYVLTICLVLAVWYGLLKS